MLSMRNHDVQDYATLRDMDATDVGVLAGDDRDCLDELGQYLVSTDGWRRFSIWLLHKHFAPGSGEVFVERTIPSPPRTRTAPMPHAAFSSGELSPTAIRFDTAADSKVGLVGMELAGPADFGGVAPINDRDEAVLSGLAERLQALGKIERFGVRLVRNPLGLSDKQILSETCDEFGRALYCDVVDRNSSPRDQTVDTTWQWIPVISHSGPTPTMKCFRVCVSECALGPPGGKPHVKGHYKDHPLGPPG
jgi:hypothetical protein